MTLVEGLGFCATCLDTGQECVDCDARERARRGEPRDELAGALPAGELDREPSARPRGCPEYPS